MALVLNDRVKETTTTTGTGTVNLGGAQTNFETFVAGIGNSNTTYYAIVHRSSAEFEIGLGTIADASPDTLARTTVISSSNSDSAVDFSAGTKDVFCTLPASKAVFEDASSDVTLPNDLILGSDSAVLKFGADSDTTLTHTDGTGLTLNSTNKLLFRDSALGINSSADGQLDLFADTEIQIVATTVDLNGELDVSGDITVGDDLTVNGGVIDVKNTGAQSVVRFYCESSNAHYAQIQAPAHSAFSGNTTLTLPAATDTLVGRATTDTLTNKSLTAPILTGSSSAAGSILFKEDTDNGTNAVTLIGPASTADVTVVLPAAADTLVGKATTDTLTNKSIDSDNNTITNIVNADIKSSAAIADSKLATISTAGKVALTALEIDGGSDIGADLTTSDLIIVDDGAGGTNKKAALSRVVTLMSAQGFSQEDPTALAIALG
jgi:hypothetical protein